MESVWRKNKRFTATAGSTRNLEPFAFPSNALWICWCSAACRCGRRARLTKAQSPDLLTKPKQARRKPARTRPPARMERSESQAMQFDLRRVHFVACAVGLRGRADQ